MLDVNLISGFVPSVGDEFEIVSSATLIGRFSSEMLPNLPGNLQWQVDYGVGDLVLRVIAGELPGDYNQDGVVNLADYTKWRDSLGSGRTREKGRRVGV